MRLRQHSSERRNERGIALIVVLIAIFVLSMLAWNFAAMMKTEMMLAHNSNNEAELEWIGRSGVEYAKWVLAANCAPYDAPSQVWAGGTSDLCATNPPLSLVQKEVQLGHGSFTWKITDQESKANINMCIAPGGDRLLQQALVLAGVDSGELTPLTGAILDWMDPDDQPHLDGAENSYYHGQDPPYDAKNGPIDDLSELLMVKGITPDLYWGPTSTNHQAGVVQQQINRPGFGNQQNGVQQNPVGLVELFTPMSSGRINVNTASAEVLQLIPGIDAMMAKAIVEGRQGEDDGSGLLGPYPTVEAVRRLPEVSPVALNGLRQFGTHESRTFQVEVTARINSYTREFVAIIRRNDRRNPRSIEVLTFYWK